MEKAVCVLQSKPSGPKGVIVLLRVPTHAGRGTTKTRSKTHITGTVTGLKPGFHGFHIHEFGDLTEGCKSLCSHYNPHNKQHGGLHDKERHIGDLGNIHADSKGVAHIDILVPHASVPLAGKYSVIGRSMIVHEDEDDLGKGDAHDSHTTGHAGKRIACGVIGISR